MSENAPATPRKILLVAVFVLGPVLVAGFVLFTEFMPGSEIANRSHMPVVLSVFAALWCLVAGLLRKSLARALVGLNGGALVGYAYGHWIVAADPGVFPVILGLMISGALMGGLLNVERTHWRHSILTGMSGGVAAFGSMGILAWLVTGIFRPNLLGWTVMCLLPVGVGLYIFMLTIARKQDLPASNGKEVAKVDSWQCSSSVTALHPFRVQSSRGREPVVAPACGGLTTG